jgi:membrane protease YdiL (CAAX protease family)
MLLSNALISAFVNLVVLAGLPFLGYAAYQRWRHKRSLADSARRAGLRLGKPRYLLYALGFALVGAIALLIWPPPMEIYLRKGSAFRVFGGLGFTPASALMALLYGLIQTGFSEEFLFRGLIAGSLFRRLPTLWANLIQAAIFLIPHVPLLFLMPKMAYLLPVIYLGALVVGWLRAKSGSIVGPWLIHGTLNLTVCLSVAVRSAA